MLYASPRPKYRLHESRFPRGELKDIIKRKGREIDAVGYTFWGYGGRTCHPKRVQSFCEEAEKQGEPVYLLMSKTPSELRAKKEERNICSEDMKVWRRIPEENLSLPPCHTKRRRTNNNHLNQVHLHLLLVRAVRAHDLFHQCPATSHRRL